MRGIISVVATAFLALLCVNANAAHISVFNALIDGDQSGTGAEGVGAGTMTYNSDTGEFSWFVAWEGLTGLPTAAHFHGPAEPGMNAGVQVPIDHTSNPSIGAMVISMSQAADLLAGLWYVNIHTEAFPGGEIRGQVLPLTQQQVIPIPAAAWLMISALGGLGFLRRRA